MQTSDLGIAIRDLLEDQEIQGNVLSDKPNSELTPIDFIDVSDADNPVIHTSAGKFRVAITRIE